MFVYFWMIWHWSFPALVVASILIDSPRRIVHAHCVRNVALITILVPLIITVLSLLIVFIERDHLPYLVIGGHLQPIDRLWFQPAIMVANVSAIIAIFTLPRRLTTLHLWLAVAMFAACLDSMLVAVSAKVYSYAWDVGKVLTVATATTILVMIVGQVVTLYRRRFEWSQRLEAEITERKRAETLFERAAIAARAGKIGIWHWDALTDARFWDDTLYELFGRQKPVELNTAFFMTSLHPDDRERVIKAYSAATGDDFNQEYRVVWDNGEVHHIRSRGKFVRAADGTTLRMTGAVWDVTQLRSLNAELHAEKELLVTVNEKLDQSERRYRTLTDAMPQLVAVLDSEHRLTYANRQWSLVTGTIPELAAPTSPSVVFHIDDREAAEASLDALHFQANVEFEVRIRQTDGDYRWHQARIVPLSDELITTARWILTLTDIQARKATEGQLREQNRLMSMAEELAHVGHWRVEVKTNEVFWSDEVYRTHGIMPGESQSIETAIAAYHSEDREIVQDCVRRAIATGEPYTFESRLFRPDGTMRYVVSSAQVERGTDGSIEALFGVFQDVTDARTAEREQGRLLERVTLATEAGQIGIWEWDINSGLSTWDSHMFELYGISECPVHETTARFFDALHPDDVERVKLANLNARSGTVPYDLEFRVIWPSGDIRHIRARATVFYDSAGAPERMIGTNWDITDVRRAEASLRESEERFRQVEKHTPIGLALVGLDGAVIRTNAALCTFLGYSQDELVSQFRESLTHPDDVERDRGATKELLDGKTDRYELEKRYLHKDGHVVWGLVSACVVRDDAGRPLYLIGQILDVTERKAAEVELKAAQSAAMIATEAKARFIATMSHEIRTPMNGVIGMTELLSLSELTEEQNEYVKVVRDSGRSLLRVIDDILDYSKIEAGKFDLDIQAFNMQSQLDSVLALFTSQYRDKGVLLTTRVDAAVPAFLRGDPGRVRQILINLVGNALKFTPKDASVRVLVESEATVDAAMRVRFTVVDTGIGIAPEVRHRLFQPFSQVDSSTSRKYGGTGLGLSICKQLVELMGGQISVTSAPGAGSAFSFVIPFVVSDGTEADTVGRPVMNDRRAAVRRRSEKVLLAEDNQVNALVAIRQFDRLGFDVTVVTDGMEALKAIEHQAFDLVFMDCHMPNMDGFEATRAIRSLESLSNCIPIVAMTANAQAEDREQCRAAGMDDYVAKPVTLSDLGAVLERWLPCYQELGG